VHSFCRAREVQFFSESAKDLQLAHGPPASPIQMEVILSIYWTDMPIIFRL
jgi:hypothetical protein